MSLSVTQWNRNIFSGQFNLQYQEGNKLTNDMFAYKFNPGTTSCVDPIISKRNAKFNSSTLTNTSTTETGVTTTVFDILEVHEFVPDDVINRNGGEVPSQYATSLASSLATWRELSIGGFLAKTATPSGYSATPNQGFVFDSEDTTGAAIFTSVADAVTDLRRNNVPIEGMHIALDWKRYTLLRKYAPSGSRDFVQGNDNSQAMGIYKFLGANIVPVNANFSLDTTVGIYASNMNSSCQYKASGSSSDDSSLLGLVWHMDAVRLLEVMKPEVQITPWAAEQSQLVVARCQYGLGAIRPDAIRTIWGDSDNI